MPEPNEYHLCVVQKETKKQTAGFLKCIYLIHRSQGWLVLDSSGSIKCFDILNCLSLQTLEEDFLVGNWCAFDYARSEDFPKKLGLGVRIYSVHLRPEGKLGRPLLHPATHRQRNVVERNRLIVVFLQPSANSGQQEQRQVVE